MSEEGVKDLNAIAAILPREYLNMTGTCNDKAKQNHSFKTTGTRGLDGYLLIFLGRSQ